MDNSQTDAHRINWIDWVKSFCMAVVVFCHLPQQEDTFHLQYLASVILSSFFFVSGYLKKKASSRKESLKKYGYSLLIPYLLYNAIYYPYWLVKYYIEQGGVVSFQECMKPIVGTLLGQLNTSFSCELNGVTWFLLALFMMHWITDCCNSHKHRKLLMLGLSVICIVLYGANKFWHFAPYITFHGFVRCLCFFFMGNLLQQAACLRKAAILKTDIIIGTSTLLLSIILFYWHIHEQRFILHIVLFYVVNCLSVVSIIHLSRSLDLIRSRIITTISLGTMLIFGLHRILIGIIDFLLEHTLHLSNIIYSWYECLILTIIIILISLPLINIVTKHYPILLGKKSK